MATKTSQTVNAGFQAGSGTFDHNKLFNRDAQDQHPISAITDLQENIDLSASTITIERNKNTGVTTFKLFNNKGEVISEQTEQFLKDKIFKNIQFIQQNEEFYFLFTTHENNEYLCNITALMTYVNRKVTAEESRAKTKETELSNGLSTLTQTVTSNYQTLANGINNEEQRRIYEDSKVFAQASGLVQDEKNRALGVEAELATYIVNLTDDVDAIKADYLKSSDKTELEGKITAEETRAKNAEDKRLKLFNVNVPCPGGVAYKGVANIPVYAQLIPQEDKLNIEYYTVALDNNGILEDGSKNTTSRTDLSIPAATTEKAGVMTKNQVITLNTINDNYLDGEDKAELISAISQEKTRAEGVEGNLSSAITAEASTRENKDTELGNKIDTKLDKPNEPVVGQGLNIPYYFEVNYDANKATVKDYTIDLLNKNKQPQTYSLDITSATTEKAGLMSKDDKVKLDAAITEHQSLDAYRKSVAQDIIDNDIKARIETLEARGRYLSNWNASTGKPTTEPSQYPYQYKSGDYYIISEVGTTNYKPDGTQYTGAASTVIETQEIVVNDQYVFDGNKWSLLKNTGKEVTFSTIAGEPKDNTKLKVELDKLDAVRNLLRGDNTHTGTEQIRIPYYFDVKPEADKIRVVARGVSLDANNTIVWEDTDIGTNGINILPATNTTAGLMSSADKIKLDDTYIKSEIYNKSEIETKLLTKQDKLTVGTNINIENNIISATDTKYTAGDNITISTDNKISAAKYYGDDQYTIQVDDANVISIHPTYKHDLDEKFETINNALATKQGLLTQGDHIQITGDVISATYDPATSTKDGLMSSSDKSKLDQLTTASGIGSATKGIYIDTNGVPQTMTYELNKTVPSNAVFTDTTYSAGTGISIDSDNKISLSTETQTTLAAVATKSTVSASTSTVSGASTAKSLNINGTNYNLPEGGTGGNLYKHNLYLTDKQTTTMDIYELNFISSSAAEITTATEIPEFKFINGWYRHNKIASLEPDYIYYSIANVGVELGSQVIYITYMEYSTTDNAFVTQLKELNVSEYTFEDDVTAL